MVLFPVEAVLVALLSPQGALCLVVVEVVVRVAFPFRP